MKNWDVMDWLFASAIFAVIVLSFATASWADTPSHWRLVERVEHGRTPTFQGPVNQIYYTSLEKCREDGSKVQIKNPLQFIFDTVPYTRLITCIEYKDGQDKPTVTP